MSRVVFASMKLAMERDSYPSASGIPERRVAEILDRSQQASDSGSVQAIDRIPDAQSSHLPHHCNSADAPLRPRGVLFPTGLHPPRRCNIMAIEHHSPSASNATRIHAEQPHKVIGMGESSDDALSIRLEQAPLAELIDAAGRVRDEGHGRHISYSRKVFIPLTHLCRDVCHYCTFAERPRAGTIRLSLPGRGARHRPRRSRRRLHGGSVHARRQAGAALPRRARGAGRARIRNHHRLSSGDVRACAARDRTPAARQSRSDEPLRDSGLADRHGQSGDHAGIAERAAVRAGRRPLWLARQAARGASRDAAGSRASFACRSRPAF